ncbi:GNAT family N-acetyltransferase [Mesorhizobium sp.]|uniref:GNAT family N-acetyltransferase n=1 Tax=Mesorhizobium sp. TaxID=1871066 RepID=UPI00338E552B
MPKDGTDPRTVALSFFEPCAVRFRAHVANCGYITAPDSVGRGVATAMCQHSLGHAAARGFLAMQFNCVVSTNERAVKLWRHLGFDVVGTIPLAFEHSVLGFVDALVMHRAL